MNILVSAGEASGDMHAAALIRALHEIDPDIRCSGIAGQYMQKEGCHTLAHIRELNVMGFGDVVKALPRIQGTEKKMLSWARDQRPEVAVLVDYPGFHMRVGAKLRQLGIPVIQYIAPKLWAWGKWRVRQLKLSQDRLACILPFEPEWFAGKGIEASYVGNPSVQSCSEGWSREAFCRRFQLDPHQPIIALLPGSRRGELKRHVPVLSGLLIELHNRFPHVQCVVPQATGAEDVMLAPLKEEGARIVPRSASCFSLPVDAAVAASGTVTLELALWDVPTVLIYRSTPAHIFFGRKLATVKHIGLVNILMGDQTVMPELIQAQCTVEKIMDELVPLIEDRDAAERQRRCFSRLRNLLGTRDPATEVAQMVISMSPRRKV